MLKEAHFSDTVITIQTFYVKNQFLILFAKLRPFLFRSRYIRIWIGLVRLDKSIQLQCSKYIINGAPRVPPGKWLIRLELVLLILMYQRIAIYVFCFLPNPSVFILFQTHSVHCHKKHSWRDESLLDMLQPFLQGCPLRDFFHLMIDQSWRPNNTPVPHPRPITQRSPSQFMINIF